MPQGNRRTVEFLLLLRSAAASRVFTSEADALGDGLEDRGSVRRSGRISASGFHDRALVLGHTGGSAGGDTWRAVRLTPSFGGGAGSEPSASRSPAGGDRSSTLH